MQQSAPIVPQGAAYASVTLLMVVYLLGFLDRIVISLLVEPIKADLGLTDTELGTIQGISFGLVMTVAALPFGWLADRRPRKKIIGVAVIFWSALTALCGFVTTGLGLLVARTGVALGEAALGPSAGPLIRELFVPEKAVRALAIYMLGIPLGGGLALLIGATILPQVNAAGPLVLAGFMLQPWQIMMVLVALPGFLLGVLVFLIPEPPRPFAKRPAAASIHEPIGYLVRHWKTFVGFGIPGISAMILTFGSGFWLPVALERTYQLSAVDSAYYLRIWGAMSIGLGLAGTLAGGRLIDALRERRKDAYLIVAMATVTLLCCSYGLFLYASTPLMALCVLIPAGLAIALPPLVATAAALEMVPRSMRSTLLAIWMTGVSVIGMSSGPPLIGFLTDHVIGDPAQIRAAFLICGCGGIFLVIPVLLVVRRAYLATQAAALEADQAKMTAALENRSEREQA